MFRKILLSIMVISLLVIMSSCTTAEIQRDKSVQSRAEMFAKAEVQVPQPIPNNFLARKMLAKYVERQDTPDHPFYIYILSDMGTNIGYFVAQAAPVNINAFLSSTEDATSYGVLTAPSLDGIYYGGSGSSQGGDGWFFFDAATDALIVLYGVKMFVSDQPLKIDVKPFTVEGK
jgi:hypothetical protein